MKKSILLIALFCASFMTYAQRMCDAAFILYSPTEGQQIKVTNTFNVVYTIKNNGPDAWKANSDSLIAIVTLGGSQITNLTQLLKFSKDFPAGDSLQLNFKNLQINLTSDLNADFCASGTVMNRGADSLRDADFANNTDCNNIDFLANTGIANSDVMMIDYVKPSVYPNPSNGNSSVSFALSGSDFVNLSIYDINGKLVKELINEKLNPGMYVESLNSSDYASGVYFVTLRTTEFSRNTKMVITK